MAKAQAVNQLYKFVKIFFYDNDSIIFIRFNKNLTNSLENTI